MQEQDLVEKFFEDATDDEMRLSALNQLSGRYNNMELAAISQPAARFSVTDDKKAAKFLARIVLTESHSREVRLIAYLVLFQVCNRPESVLPPINQFRIPEDLDFPFLHECVR